MASQDSKKASEMPSVPLWAGVKDVNFRQEASGVRCIEALHVHGLGDCKPDMQQRF